MAKQSYVIAGVLSVTLIPALGAGTALAIDSPAQVEKKLLDRGFRDLNWVDRRLPGYVVEACQGNARVRLRLNRNTVIRKQENIGRCEPPRAQGPKGGGGRGPTLSENDLRDIIQSRGYRRVKVIDTKPPQLVAEACRSGDRFRLTLNRFGEIRRNERIGDCGGNADRDEVIQASDLRRLMRSFGYNRIKLLDREAPRLVAEGCKQRDRYRITFNKFGRVTDERRVGDCRRDDKDPAYASSPKVVEDILEAQRYSEIRFIDNRLPVYVVEACRGIRQFRLSVDRFGEIKKRQRIGWCSVRNMKNLVKGPRRQVTDVMINAKGKLSGRDCQDYLETLLEETNILFETASAEITSDNYPLLNRLARVANRCPGTNIEVAGHTDSDGSRSYNQSLSEQRAFSVASYLEQKGVSRSRLRPVGYGEDRPVAENDSPGQKALNRRIEFVVDWEDN